MQVFISYAHTDKAFARELMERLEALGINTWFDEHRLEPGALWEAQIKKALSDSDSIVVVLPHGKPSPFVLVEMGFALGQKKKVLPVAVGSDTDTSGLPDLSQLQVIRSQSAEQAAKEIAKALESE